jgi:hypothetical protein
MNEEQKELLQLIRSIANEKGVKEITLDKLHKSKRIPQDVLKKYYTGDENLVKDILAEERKKFEEIFIEHDFDGYYDAIDILFTVSRDMAGKFYHLSPSVTYKWKDIYPEIYQDHIDKRIDFIYEKINVNIQKGIISGLYRNDISTELVARRYISRLLDLHDPDNFPPEEFSFTKLFEQMFESFVESIATEKGQEHFEKKKKFLGYLS